MNNLSYRERDLKHVWHPCTQMKDYEFLPLIPLKHAKGVYLYDFEGNRYLDSISSWWVNLFGHSNDYINSKIKEQCDSLEHVILTGFTHEPIIHLSERLVHLTNHKLTRCFYAENGSSAVEIALKMSYHYFKNQGKEKTLFVSLSNSYHGETMGALGVSDVGLYKKTYSPILLHSTHSPVPKDRTEEAALEAAETLKKLFEEKSEEISALIVEPLLQCAGLMHMYHPRFLIEARALCDAYGIHLILDEIATGFGRTGTLFAHEQAGITGDFLCLSKGLTGGYLPLAAVLTNDTVYEAFYDDYAKMRAFLHSHSYTGNALGCAAANATLDIFENESVMEKNIDKAAYMHRKLQNFRDLPNVKEVRQIGMVVAVELQGYAFEERVGIQIYKKALEKGIYIRPLSHVVYFMPPYVIMPEEIDTMMDVALEAVKSVIK